MSQGVRSPRGSAHPPPPRGEIASDLALPGARSLGISSLGISPPFGDLFLRFRSSYFLYINCVKNNGEKIGHFDTCTNYSRWNQCNTLISCKRCVRGSAKRYFARSCKTIFTYTMTRKSIPTLKLSDNISSESDSRKSNVR